MDNDEKVTVEQAGSMEAAQPKGAGGAIDADDFGFTPAEQRKIIRRIDYRLVVMCGLLYCVSLMDRTNIGVANIAGMKKDLDLVGTRYSIISLTFFITYIVFQPPSTILIRKLGPRPFLAAITFCWGILGIGMGFVKKWDQLVALRIVLGIMEAGFFPGCVYLLSTWYTRFEVGKRYSVFYLIGAFAATLAGILAFGFMQMDGLQGLEGWRWIFIMMGVITLALAIAGYWLLVNFPDSKHGSAWKFLNERELAWVAARVQADRGDAAAEKFSLRKYMGGGADWKVWIYALMFFCTDTVTYSLAYFLPLILVGNMGFTVEEAQCLQAPPYAVAGIVMYVNGWISDKYRIRGPIIVFNMLLCIIGLPIMGFHPSAAVRYFGVFLVTTGSNANVPAVMTYQANNIRGQWKRAFASGSLIVFGGLGGVAGSLVFRSQDAPYYRPGLYACLACCILTIILVVVMSVHFWFENAKADRGEKELECNDEDQQPGFRYTY